MHAVRYLTVIKTIFWEFLRLGCTSFGGPAAHIGYFHRRFAQELQWLKPEDFASTLALCQFLPGPSSSQLGFAIGYRRGGLGGALAAFLGFTTPSALIMLGAGLGGHWLFSNGPWSAVITMLQLTAVIVVADAVLSLYARYCQHSQWRWLAGLWFLGFLLQPSQLPLLLLAGAVGARLAKPSSSAEPTPMEAPQTGLRWGWLIPVAVLAVGAALLGGTEGWLAQTAGFAHAGLWVFGGGHVVLPMLQHQFPMLDSSQFLAGYGLAQALPGPLFSFAAYVGTQVFEQPVWGGLLALLAIFAPGFCLLLALLDHWQALAQRPRLAGAVAGLNAAVVALLAASLWHPVITHSVLGLGQLVTVAIGLWLLRVRQLPVLWLLALALVLGLLEGFGARQWLDHWLAHPLAQSVF